MVKNSKNKLVLVPVASAILLVSLSQIPGIAKAADRVLRLEKIVVSGNSHIKDEAIIAAIRLDPGDTVSVEVLGRERRRLLTVHQLLTSVEFSTRPGAERGLVIVEIEVVERSRLSFETGYGYHDNYGWFLTLLGMRADRLFDSDSQLRLGVRLGFNIAGFDAEWKNPCPAGGGMGFGATFHVYSENHHFFGRGEPATGGTGGEENSYTWNGPHWREFRQGIARAGGDFSLRYRLGGTRFSFGLKAEAVEPDSSFEDVERDRTLEFDNLPGRLKPDADKTVITGLFFRVIRDTRDYFIYPRSGSYTSLQMEANNTILGGDELFTRLVFDFRRHIHAGGDHVFSGRMNAGVVSRGAPYYERFSLGGIYSIRGFKELSLSPTGGADGFWLVGGEFRFPLISSPGSPPRLSGLVFIDAGQGWLRGHPFSSSDIQSAAGYGVRLRLPWLGTLGFDVGIPFSEGRTGENFRIHGSLGFSF